MGDLKELPLMKGTERMIGEKVDGGGGRVSVHEGLCRGPKTEESRQTCDLKEKPKVSMWKTSGP